MKRYTKVSILILVFTLLFTNFTTYAFGQDDAYRFSTNTIDSKIEQYFAQNVDKYFHTLKRNPQNYGIDSIGNLNYSKLFSVYSYIESDESKTFAASIIFNDETPIGYFWVNNNNGDINITMSIGNTEKLISLKNKHLRMVDYSGDVYAVSEGIPYLILDNKNFNSNSNELKNMKFNKSKVQEIIPAEKQLYLAEIVGKSDEYNGLDMDIVLQGNHPWCWAATCAAIINYIQNENLSARDVVEYVFGSAVDMGGTWKNMKKAYNHWGLTPREYKTLTYSEVKNLINNNQPIHIGMYTSTSGHSMTLRGYEKWSDGDIIYYAIDPNYNHYVSFDGDESGENIYYILGGSAFYWQKSRFGW
ncbi:papain-like cysteine protease family protein [Abyssisolibacter fermentans]|uniref:papain-like cysteine protease family protein n=1 Tax=Abyssisolibacter fermentans TaxID=1766203 RepID=UPI000829A5DD|nr:papain-like cysteine protease family protein [Abyssisolibacter fermentans]